MNPRIARQRKRIVAGLIGLGLIAFSERSAGLKIELPVETEVFKPGPNADIANAQCLICHSTEYVTTQPPQARAFWKNSVLKMQDKYGAPIAADQVEALADYLVRHYGRETSTNSAVSRVASPESLPAKPAEPLDGARLAARYACQSCHQPKVRLIGPAFQQIAIKYASDATAAEKIAQQITKGGSGKWGPIPMPPFVSITHDEIQVLADWILGQK